MASKWIVELKDGTTFELNIRIDEDKISDVLSSTRRCAVAYSKARRTGKARITRLGGGVIADVRLIKESDAK